MLWMFQRVNYGPVLNEKNRKLPDLSVRERWVIWPTVALAVFMGVAPRFFLYPMERSVARIVQRMQAAGPPIEVRRGSEGARVRPSTSSGRGEPVEPRGSESRPRVPGSALRQVQGVVSSPNHEGHGSEGQGSESRRGL
jgi:hypothetical protein